MLPGNAEPAPPGPKAMIPPERDIDVLADRLDCLTSAVESLENTLLEAAERICEAIRKSGTVTSAIEVLAGLGEGTTT